MPEKEINRTAWLDCARGAAILLVVAGHICEGFFTQESIFGDITPMRLSWDIIYSFHMPLMFLTSGCAAALSTHIRKRAWLHDAIALYLPYIFFSLFYLFAKTFLFHSATPVPASRWLSFWVYPVGIFWFLPALLVIRILHRFLLARMGKWSLAVWAALAVIGSLPFWPDALLLPQDIFCFGICYAAGYCWLKAADTRRADYIAAIVAVVLSAASLLVPGSISGFPRRILIGLCVALCVSVLFRRFHVHIPGLDYLGRHSLPIYLLHSFMTGPLFLILARFTHNMFAVLAAGILLEILVSLLCEQIWRRVPFLHWAEFLIYPAKFFSSFSAKREQAGQR